MLVCILLIGEYFVMVGKENVSNGNCKVSKAKKSFAEREDRPISSAYLSNTKAELLSDSR